MKYKSITALVWLLLLTPFISHAEPRKELIPSYEITKNEADKSLTPKEALFVFTFKNISWPAKIKGACNGVQKTISTSSKGEYSLKTIPGKYIFQFYYNEEFYEIYTDSIKIEPGYRIEININFESSLYPAIMDKPVIYAYAPASTAVHIQLDLKGELLFTYPQYINGWDFTTGSQGTIQMENHEYKYLFWEGTTDINSNKTDWNEGFVVERKNLLLFLEKVLGQMGLSSMEQQDYITYWYPLMNKNEKNYVHFLFNEEYNEYASISVTPKPDNMFRVYMLWANAEGMEEIKLKDQVIPSFKHEGFTLVEWGGSQLTHIPLFHL